MNISVCVWYICMYVYIYIYIYTHTHTYIYDFGKGGTYNQTHIVICIAASHEEQKSPWKIIEIFQIQGDARIGLMKFSPENIYLKICSASFPEHRVSNSLSPPELLSIHIESDGKWQSPVHSCLSLWVYSSNRVTDVKGREEEWC